MKLPKGWKTPKLGKYCPKCKNKVGCACQTCPICAYAFSSSTTTRVTQRPANTCGLVSVEVITALLDEKISVKQLRKLLPMLAK